MKKARPFENYSLLGTNVILDKNKLYNFSVASNIPNHVEKGLIFIHATDDEDSPGVLLESGEYEIVNVPHGTK